MIEHIKDKWLTWSTGLSREDRIWRRWQEETIVRNASTIENMFMNFKYILPVSTNIFDLDEPFGWSLCEDFQQYMYPRRDLDNCVVYHFARGERDQWDGKFHLDEMGGYDQLFVATNNSADAVMIALKYS